ncbi:hypothetical protein X763_04740 [Mesorhizobium sp. LSHC432A00]|nr:hypothetical protein X763_04740 [Mesorhizobium sp. LSHC432A00]
MPPIVIGRGVFMIDRRSAKKALYFPLSIVVFGIAVVFGGHDVTPAPFIGIGSTFCFLGD